MLWDVLPNGKVLGGAPANFAYHAHVLGLAPYVVTALGHDELGREAARILGERGLDASLIQWSDKHPTGTVDVTLDKNGTPDFTINTGAAYDQVELNGALIEAARKCRVLYFGTLIQRTEKSRSTLQYLLEQAADALKFLDINLRRNCFSRETVKDSLEAARILKLNDGEVAVLSEMLSLPQGDLPSQARLLISQFNLEACLITLGADGALALDSHGQQVCVPGCKAQVVDSIGAGDAFAAAFLSRYLDGSSLKECCEFANLYGAYTVTKKGGMPAVSMEELSVFEKSTQRGTALF